MKYYLLLLTSIVFLSCGENKSDKYIDLVKSGNLEYCPEKTLETLVNDYFQNPEWKSLQADDNLYYVNIVGGVTYGEKPAKATVQFKITSDTTYELFAIEIEGEAMTDDIHDQFIRGVCGESTNNNSENLQE